MSPRFFEEWRSARRARRGLSTFVTALMDDPEPDDVAWLAAVCAGDADRAAWELRYARRALGLIVAQRDALDDRTGSLVARELAHALQSDRNTAPSMLKVSERQFNERLTAYRDVLTMRAATEGTAARLGRALLSVAGASGASDDLCGGAGDILVGYLAQANESLRHAFGAPALPEAVPPSAVSR